MTKRAKLNSAIATVKAWQEGWVVDYDNVAAPAIDLLLALAQQVVDAPTMQWDVGDWRMPGRTMCTKEYEAMEAAADALAGKIVALLPISDEEQNDERA